MSVQDDINSIVATEATISSVRAAATPLLNALITAVNKLPGSGTKSTVAAALTPFVLQYNKLAPPVTDLHAEVPKLVAEYAAAPSGTPVPSTGAQAALPPRGMVKDKAGRTWSFGALAGGQDYRVLRDGIDAANIASLLAVDDSGNVWTRDTLNNWFTLDATGKLSSSLLNPWGGSALNVIPQSMQIGGRVGFSAPNSNGFLVDVNMARWGCGNFAPGSDVNTLKPDFVIKRNDVPFVPAGASLPLYGCMLYNKDGTVWVYNAAGALVYPRA